MKIKDIKYRAWDGVEFSYSDGFPSLEAFFGMNDDKGYSEIPVRFDRWTGFSDVNDKPIYSGDIVTNRPKSNKSPFYLVNLNNKIVNRKGDDWIDNESVPNFHWEELRVIGNIRENKEFSYFKSIFEQD